MCWASSVSQSVGKISNVKVKQGNVLGSLNQTCIVKMIFCIISQIFLTGKLMGVCGGEGVISRD